MSNLEAHKKLLKYSFDKIETIEEYNEKLGYLDRFFESGVIDQSSFDQLLKYLKKQRPEKKGQ